jgi:hypothetical protein
MEYWSDGILIILKDVVPLLFLVKIKFAINRTFQYPKAHCPNIPAFSPRRRSYEPEANIPSGA